MAIDNSWIGSLDISTFVNTQMMREQAAIEKSQQPFLDQLTQKQTNLKAQSAVYNQLQQLITTFQQSLTQLKTAFDPTYQVGYSTSGVVSAQITGSVSPGSHSLQVTQLATAGSLQSQNVLSTNTALGYTQTLTIALGPTGTPTQQFNVNISSTDNLKTIVAKINNTAQVNNAGVTASIVSTISGQYQLVVSSNQTGLANNINITTASGSGLTMTTLKGAKDAEFSFDNLDFVQASNSNTIQGMDITLLNQGSTNVIVTPNSQTSTVTNALQNVVTSYNQVMSLIGQSQAQLATPDPTLSLIQSTLQDEMDLSGLNQYGIVPDTTPQTVQVNTASGGVITVYLTGLIQTDPTMLSTALANNFSSMQSALFDSQNGVFTKVLSNGLNPGTGLVWKGLNDSISGGIPLVNTHLNQVTQQIQDETAQIQQKKADLTAKYAQLQVTLQSMQNISNYMFQQIQMMGNK